MLLTPLLALAPAPTTAPAQNQDLYMILWRLGMALGLGLLVGLQREYVFKTVAGIRTFPLITLFGAVCALLSLRLGGWVLAAGLLAVAALAVVASVIHLRSGLTDPGLTTDAAVLLMFGVGAYVMVGRPEIALALGGLTAVLLQFKQPLHTWVRKIGDQDIRAIMQFALITLVILPVLPNRALGPGPYQVWNPFQIWLLVVLIVGLSLIGYVAYKFVSANTGAILGGLLGGMISSTATTVSYARRSRQPGQGPGAAAAIMIASTIMYGRILVLILVTAPALLAAMGPPILVLGAFSALLSAGAVLTMGKPAPGLPEQGNPTQLRSALVFGAIFAAVLLASAVARAHLGGAGLYGVALIAGLTDVDAITLSSTHLGSLASHAISPSLGWRLIVAASLANLVFKGAAALLMGSGPLRRRIALLFPLAGLAGLALIFFWPG